MEGSSSLRLLHPITVFLFQAALTICAVGFTTPSSVIRLAMIPLILACMYAVRSDYLDSFPREVFASIVAGSTYSGFLQYLDIVILSQWSFDGHDPEIDVPKLQRRPITREKMSTLGDKTNKGADVTSVGDPPFSASFSAMNRRFQYGYFINSANRLIGTDHQVKNVPNYITSDPDFVPSRARFLLRKISIFCICYLALDLATVSANPPENNSQFRLEKIPFFRRLGEVNSDEIIQRLVASVANWAAAYCVMQCYMGAWAAFCVALGDDPKYWRPNFGPLSEGYTIRRFWGKFWHQHLRRPLTSNATFLTESVLRLSQPTLLRRYTHLTLVFFLSGLMHMFTAVAGHGGAKSGSAFSFSNSGCIEFFLAQALGIMIEDGAQAIGRRVEKLLGLQLEAGTKPTSGRWWWWSWMKKALGWVWLVAFLGWSTPAMMYPAARLNTGKGKDVLLPFSVIKALSKLMS